MFIFRLPCVWLTEGEREKDKIREERLRKEREGDSWTESEGGRNVVRNLYLVNTFSSLYFINYKDVFYITTLKLVYSIANIIAESSTKNVTTERLQNQA